MAVIASGRESCRAMVRIFCLIVIRFVAPVAVAWCTSVHSVLVARCASRSGMAADQLEVSVVIEHSAMPIRIRRLVAGIAVCGESCGPVVRIICLIVLGLVAPEAGIRCSFEHPVFVACLAAYSSVFSNKREEVVVIDVRAMPVRIRGSMASFTIGGISGGAMVRTRG